MSPSMLFEQFFDDEVITIELITAMSNLYSAQQSKQLGVTSSEMFFYDALSPNLGMLVRFLILRWVWILQN